MPPTIDDREGARAAFGIPPDATCVLIFGGSLGARSINLAAVEAFADAPVHVLHVPGARDFADLRAPGPHYHLHEYVDPFGRALVAADLVVARAGGSVFELAQYGLPAVLVPYPHASADHQTANARWMAEAGAATILRDDELTPQRLRAEVDGLLADPDRLRAMAAASRALARPDAAQVVAREVLAAARATAALPPADRRRSDPAVGCSRPHRCASQPVGTPTAVEQTLSVNDWMNRAAASIEAEADHLTQLDAAIGDGDHGINMMRGMRAVTAALADGDPDAPPGKRLLLAGKTLVSTVGGASGPLWGSALRHGGRELGDTPELDGAALVEVLTAALAAVQDLGAAEPGDKTMVDALGPALATLRERARRRRPAGRRARRGGRCGRRGRARNDADAGAQGARVVPGRALRRASGPGRDVDRSDRPSARQRRRRPGLTTERRARRQMPERQVRARTSRFFLEMPLRMPDDPSPPNLAVFTISAASR